MLDQNNYVSLCEYIESHLGRLLIPSEQGFIRGLMTSGYEEWKSSVQYWDPKWQITSTHVDAIMQRYVTDSEHDIFAVPFRASLSEKRRMYIGFRDATIPHGYQHFVVWMV